MEIVSWILATAGVASLAAWLFLLTARGGFWLAAAEEDASVGEPPGPWPSVAAVVPARNEAAVLPATLPALLGQEYPGPFRVILVDDHSEDSTAEAARRVARDGGWEERLTVASAAPLGPGWTGKLWALRCGLAALGEAEPEYLFFTDADIAHAPDSLVALVARAEGEDRDLVSVMAELRAASLWERLLVPAFVYFFALLYPFRWVRDPDRATAAAAGGCLLVRRDALARAGGLEAVAGELIDDCSLARRVKGLGRPGGGRLWLGFSSRVVSLRAYGSLGELWEMVARTAFTQLRHSNGLLAVTVVGMLLLFGGPPLAAVWGVGAALGAAPQWGWLAVVGLGGWAAMAGSYLPTLHRYGLRASRAALLPLTAALYVGMTVDSALRHWRGVGGGWKGRTYGG